MYIDEIINLFFIELGGIEFLGLVGATLIIIAILISLIRPLDF